MEVGPITKVSRVVPYLEVILQRTGCRLTTESTMIREWM